MRTGKAERLTKETTIQATICLDGGDVEVSTGIGFFDHMLEAFAVHGGFGLKLQAVGDLYVDGHHTVEDTGIVLGRAMAEALGGKSGHRPLRQLFRPHGREPGLRGRGCQRPPPSWCATRSFRRSRVGEFDACLTPEFFRAFAQNAGLTLHLRCEYGANSHHIIEALFKAAAHALRLAVAPKEGTLSTKGSID